jgi:restriction system protein
MQPTLRALQAMGGSATNEELLGKIIEQEKYPSEVQSVQHVDHRQTKLNYNLAWAKTYLKKIGAIDNSSRGIRSITKKGERLTDEEIKAVPATVRRMDAYARRERENIDSKNNGDPGEIAEAHWEDQLIHVLRSLSSEAFERLAQRILREAGFTRVEVTGRSGDGGIDGIGVLRVNLLSFQVLFQCKKYQGSVGAGAIRDFRGAMVGRTDKGLMITTGTFTPDAKREATRDGAPAIDLIDGELLCDLLKDLKLGVQTRLVEQMTVDKDWLHSV